MTYFPDSNICIYFLKGLYPQIARSFGERHPREIMISSIVKAELLYGAEKSARRDRNLKAIVDFLEPFETAGFDDEAAKEYAYLRSALEKKGSPIGPNDLMLAATVLARGGVLVTNNTREFRRVRGLRLENWCS